MTPTQKFLLSCRQTREAATRLNDWIQSNPSLLGIGQAAVREDLDGLSASISPLALAAEKVAAIGLVSTECKAKSDLLFAMISARTPLTVAELGPRPFESATIQSLLPQPSDPGGCAVVRFSTAELPPVPRGYPLQITLLGMTEIAAILARASHTAFAHTATAPTASDIEALFAGLSTRLSSQAVPGLSEHDVIDLLETLNHLLPDHPILSALSATQFWPRFREIAAHISNPDRRVILAHLWSNDPAFTALFNRLCEGLESLGHGAEAYCPPEAILGKDPQTGWMTRHPRSIIQASTLSSLTQQRGPALSVTNRFGQSVDIERAVIAGLIAELPLHLGQSRLNDLSAIEILDFPIAPPIAFHGPVLPLATDDDLDRAVARYARAKAIYLLERACLHRELSGLIAVVNPERADDTLAPAIGDWVEGSQGRTPHARERVRRGLFVAITRSNSPRTPVHSTPSSPSGIQLETFIKDVLGANQDWPQAWTPGRPMSEFFYFDHDASHQPSSSMQQVPGTKLAVASRQPLVPAFDQPAITNLLRALAVSSGPNMKQVQLNQALQEVRRRLHTCLLRHHASNDPTALSNWRRSMALVVQDRLLLLIERNKLGHLIHALLPSESDFKTVFETALLDQNRPTHANAASQSWRQSQRTGNRAAPGLRSDHQVATTLAEQAVDFWFREIRRAARSGRLCRELSIEPTIFQNLADELQIGAVRTSLASEIANVFIQSRPPRQPDRISNAGPSAQTFVPEQLAAVTCRLVNAYLELLAAPSGRNRRLLPLPLSSPATEGDLADRAVSGYASTPTRSPGSTRRSGNRPLEQWETSFVALVEDNIAAAHLLVGRSDKDRELGELIQLFASGPFEVEI